MGLITGGYILDRHQAKEWADKRFPDAIKWGDPRLVHVPINNYLNSLLNNPGDDRVYQRCIVVPWGQDSVRICFPTVWMRGRKITRAKHDPFPENDFALARKKVLFEEAYEALPHLKDLLFVTIYDPLYDESP
ncbi:hypothetical protein PAXINDRAFT_138920 [Paxillus involutus ATCC 200175]|uniref:Uncharacterized protein n=1 Tax=Paxillus involutus ATCC 200175 TaxID=664439 RepID=A0A0C9TE24_PAXIN|nr:hypothetical protein PAXINDRAFT_138920 [Paxillus involutus ATCC 200175]